MFEVFEHTADLGIRVRAPSLEGLFKEAAEAMIQLMCRGPQLEDTTSAPTGATPSAQAASPPTEALRATPTELREVTIPAKDLPIPEPQPSPQGTSSDNGSRIVLPPTWEDLLHDWLSTILYLFSVERLVPVDYQIQFDSTGLKARLKVRAYDPVRDGGEVEIKAVTYHGLRIEKEANEFTAQVIFDV